MGRVEREKGVLVIVMNYTGDVLNFGVAVEKARAAGEGGGGKVEMVVVGDDVGVGRAAAGKVGRRGIAGTVLVIKIAGALAAQGRCLEDVTKVAGLVAENLVSVGASLERVHVPGRKVDQGDEEALGEGEVEIGMGIHNEVGSGRKVVELQELVRIMLNQLLDTKDRDRAFLAVNSNEVVLLVNNLGGVSPLELGGITNEVVGQLRETWNIRPVRILSGTFMTSLNGLGFSISLLNVVNTDIGGPGMIELLDAPTEALGWSANVRKETWEEKNSMVYNDKRVAGNEDAEPSGLEWDAQLVYKALQGGLESVIAAEPDVTRFDTVVGDGDCGIGLKRGAEALLNLLNETPLSSDVLIALSRITGVVETSMDGTSGALYAIFLNSLLHSLRQQSTSTPKKITPQIWAEGLQASLKSLLKYTPAQPGDRTLIDALYPFVEVLAETGSLGKAAEASRKGAAGTKGMKASLGRTVYIGGEGFMSVPDPGAYGLSEFFAGLGGVGSGSGDDGEYELV